MEFEHIDDWHQRAKVFGGWLVKAHENVFHLTDSHQGDGWDWRISMAFVPDSKHEWKIDMYEPNTNPQEQPNV